MKEYTAETKEMPELIAALWELLAGARGAFGQERVYRRAMALVLGEIFTVCFAGNTRTLPTRSGAPRQLRRTTSRTS